MQNENNETLEKSLATSFTYERGHEYELLVKRTTLANPPQDSGKYRYELVRIVSDKKLK